MIRYQYAEEIRIPIDSIQLAGTLMIPEGADSMIVFAHGSGYSFGFSPADLEGWIGRCLRPLPRWIPGFFDREKNLNEDGKKSFSELKSNVRPNIRLYNHSLPFIS